MLLKTLSKRLSDDSFCVLRLLLALSTYQCIKILTELC